MLNKELLFLIYKREKHVKLLSLRDKEQVQINGRRYSAHGPEKRERDGRAAREPVSSAKRFTPSCPKGQSSKTTDNNCIQKRRRRRRKETPQHRLLSSIIVYYSMCLRKSILTIKTFRFKYRFQRQTVVFSQIFSQKAVNMFLLMETVGGLQKSRLY